MSETKTFEELFLSYSKEENVKVNKLKILLINNINSNYMYLLKLKEWQIKQEEYFDYLFYLGNFMSFSENKNKNDIKEICNDEAEIGGLLSYLENICLNIVYIGGSNDTPTIFQKPYPTLTLKSKNLHNNYHKLSEDLYLIGYGGYINKNLLDDTFSNFEDYKKESNKTQNTQLILICNDSKNDEFYKNIIKNKKKDIFLFLNGNIKLKKGEIKLGEITMLNPGSICDGEFAILFLERDIGGKWKIQTINYLII